MAHHAMARSPTEAEVEPQCIRAAGGGCAAEIGSAAQARSDGRLDRLADALAELSTAVEELRVAEEELRSQNDLLAEARDLAEHQRTRYDDLFDRAPDGYLVTDWDGLVRAANPAAARILKARRDYVVGKPLAVFIPEPDRRAFRDRLADLCAGKPVDGWLLVIRAHEGVEATHAIVNAIPGVDPVDGAAILRWTLRDVSETRALEAKVRDMDHSLWVRVVERTNALTLDNERLRAEVAILRADLDRQRATSPDGAA